MRQMKGRFPFPLCEFDIVESDLPSNQKLPLLPLNPVPDLDLENAEQIDYVFEWEGAVTPADKSGKAIPKFWLMNKRAWEGMSKDNIPAPLSTLELGKTYIFNLKNVTQYHHPIHLHGHTFTVLELDGKNSMNRFIPIRSCLEKTAARKRHLLQITQDVGCTIVM